MVRMPKVSVIVPIYNVAGYIERCVTSLFEQTLDDIEYIFIDDCTPDNSMEVLQSVIEKYQLRFVEEKKVVRTERMLTNSHQATVRKHGIQLATGDFIIHCDSDDWVDNDLYEKMYNEAIRSGADVVMCPICDEYKDHARVRPMNVLFATCPEVVENWYKISVSMYTWNKLVRRSIHTDHNILPFEGINMWEDNGLMMRVMYHAKGLSQIEGSVYHYNQANITAMTSGYGREAINQMIKCANELDAFFKSKPDTAKFEKTIKTIKFMAKLNLVTARFDWLREFHCLFLESNEAVKWIGLDAFSNKGKIRFFFVKYHLAWLFVLMFKIKNSLTK